jgi:hypothetical protein
MKRVGQTGYAEIVRLAECRSLRLELRLDDVERTGRNTRGETTARASCERGVPIGERPESLGEGTDTTTDLSCC